MGTPQGARDAPSPFNRCLSPLMRTQAHRRSGFTYILYIRSQSPFDDGINDRTTPQDKRFILSIISSSTKLPIHSLAQLSCIRRNLLLPHFAPHVGLTQMELSPGPLPAILQQLFQLQSYGVPQTVASPQACLVLITQNSQYQTQREPHAQLCHLIPCLLCQTAGLDCLE